MRVEGRAFFRPREGYIGFATSGAAEGDCIYFIKGCRTPMILRHVEVGDQTILIADCYFHGFMYRDMFNETAYNHL